MEGVLKGGLALAVVFVIAVVMLMLVSPMIEAAKEAAKIAEFEAAKQHYELVVYLQSQLKETRLADPYNPRWWNKKLTPREYGMLEKALDDFMNDTERDGSAETALAEALRQVGIDVGRNIADAVHAANHLVNKTKAPIAEPLPPSVQEDVKEWEEQNNGE